MIHFMLHKILINQQNEIREDKHLWRQNKNFFEICFI